MGLDDVLHPWFEQSSIEASEAALAQGAISQCRTLLQRGACPALRPRLWATALAQDLQLDSTEQSFQQLCSQVEQCNLLTDLLVCVLHNSCVDGVATTVLPAMPCTCRQ